MAREIVVSVAARAASGIALAVPAPGRARIAGRRKLGTSSVSRQRSAGKWQQGLESRGRAIRSGAVECARRATVRKPGGHVRNDYLTVINCKGRVME